MELHDTGSEHVSEISKFNCKYVHFICLLVGCFLFFCNFVITRVGLCGWDSWIDDQSMFIQFPNATVNIFITIVCLFFLIARVGLCGCPAAAMSSQLRGW